MDHDLCLKCLGRIAAPVVQVHVGELHERACVRCRRTTYLAAPRTSARTA